MRITSKLTGGMRFETDIRGHNVIVDLTEAKGGTDTGPMPPELLVTSLGTCVGVYAVNFCRKHNLSTEGLLIHTDYEQGTAPSRISHISVTVELPCGVTEEKLPAFMRTIEQCLVHNTFCQTPEIKIELAETCIV